MDFIHASIDYLDIPTYQRQAMTDEDNGNGHGHESEFEFQEEKEESKPGNYEMPTFLRRRMEM
jgi:hypothetical protein